MKKYLGLGIVLVLLAGLAAALIFFRGDTINVDNEQPSAPSDEVAEEAFATSTDTYEVNVEYPPTDTVGSGEVRSAIDQEIASFITIAEEDVPELREEGFQHKYNLSNVIETTETDTHISYLVFFGMYTGGANSNETANSFVFDKTTGERIALTDVVPADERSAFVTRVREALLDTQNTTSVFEDIVADLQFEQLRTFVLEENGDVTLVFSKYEVAPGAAGIVRVTVPRASDTSEVSQEEPEEDTYTVALNEPFEVNGSTITVREVVGDSRCPVDVTCIWAGTVTIALDIQGNNDVVEPIELSLTESFNTASHTVTFTGVSPEPRSDTEIDPSDYRFTFSVAERA